MGGGVFATPQYGMPKRDIFNFFMKNMKSKKKYGVSCKFACGGVSKGLEEAVGPMEEWLGFSMRSRAWVNFAARG